MSPEIHFRPDDLSMGGAPERGEGAHEVTAKEIIRDIETYKKEIKENRSLDPHKLSELNSWIKKGQELLGKYLESAPGFEDFASKIVEKTEIFNNSGKVDWGEYFREIISVAQEFEEALDKEKGEKYVGIFDAAVQSLVNKLDMERKRVSKEFGPIMKANALDRFEDFNFVPTGWFEERYNINSLTGDMSAEVARPSSRDVRGVEAVLLQEIAAEQRRVRMIEEERVRQERRQWEERKETLETPEDFRNSFRRLEKDAKVPVEGVNPNIMVKDLEGDTKKWWEIRYKLARALYHKVNTFSFDDLYPSNPIGELTKDEISFLFGCDEVQGRQVWRVPGFMHAVSLYTAIVVDGVDLNEFFDRDLNSTETQRNDAVYGKFKNGGTVFDFKELSDLDTLVSNVALWLSRHGVVREKIENGDDVEINADDVARAAWNFFTQGNVVEYEDSRYKRNNNSRIPPMDFRLMSLPIRISMHPQERLEQKAKDGESEWSVPFGSWSASVLRKKKRHVISGRLFRGEKSNVLPKELYKDAFSYMGAKKEGKKEITFRDVLLGNGRKILHIRPNMKLETLDFNEVSETPFSKYIFGAIDRAKTINEAIVRGRIKTWRGLADAFSELEVDRKYRENIVKGVYVVAARTAFKSSYRLRVKYPSGENAAHFRKFVDEANEIGARKLKRNPYQRVAAYLMDKVVMVIDNLPI